MYWYQLSSKIIIKTRDPVSPEHVGRSEDTVPSWQEMCLVPNKFICLLHSTYAVISPDFIEWEPGASSSPDLTRIVKNRNGKYLTTPWQYQGSQITDICSDPFDRIFSWSNPVWFDNLNPVHTVSQMRNLCSYGIRERIFEVIILGYTEGIMI